MLYTHYVHMRTMLASLTHVINRHCEDKHQLNMPCVQSPPIKADKNVNADVGELHERRR